MLHEQPPLGQPAFADVDGEARRVERDAVARVRARVDQHVEDAAVLPAQPRLVGVQRLVAREPGEQVEGDVGVGVERGDPPPDVLGGGVAEQAQLGLVRPQDRAVRPQPVDGDGGVVPVGHAWFSSIAHGHLCSETGFEPWRTPHARGQG
jgi:hypothetical protein